MQEQKKGGRGFQPTAAALQKDKKFTVTCKNTEGLSLAKILQFLSHHLHSVYGPLKFFSCSLENHMPFPLALYPRNSVVRRNEWWYGTTGVLLLATLCHILDPRYEAIYYSSAICRKQGLNLRQTFVSHSSAKLADRPLTCAQRLLKFGSQLLRMHVPNLHKFSTSAEACMPDTHSGDKAPTLVHPIEWEGLRQKGVGWGQSTNNMHKFSKRCGRCEQTGTRAHQK